MSDWMPGGIASRVVKRVGKRLRRLGQLGTPRLAPYVPRIGEQCFSPPGVIKGGHVHAWVLKGHTRNIQTHVCDRFFNEPAGGELKYVALSDAVVLTFLNADRLGSGGGHDRHHGLIRERQVAVWVLLLAVDPATDEPRGAVWHMPHLITDTSIVMGSGLNTWGLPTEVGPITLPAGPDDAPRWVGNATLFHPLGSNIEGELGPLYTVERTDPGAETFGNLAEEDTIQGLDKLVRTFLEGQDPKPNALAPRGPERPINILDVLVRPEIPLVNLKEFRDAHSGTLACYMSIVESAIRVDGTPQGGFLPGEYQVAIKRAESHPLVEALGLQEGTWEDDRYVMRPRLSLWADLGFSALPGREVWRAGS